MRFDLATARRRKARKGSEKRKCSAAAVPAFSAALRDIYMQCEKNLAEPAENAENEKNGTANCCLACFAILGAFARKRMRANENLHRNAGCRLRRKPAYKDRNAVRMILAEPQRTQSGPKDESKIVSFAFFATSRLCEKKDARERVFI